MLRKIKKAHDLVFTKPKRRSRRTAIGSPELSKEIVNSLELGENSKLTELKRESNVFNDYSARGDNRPSPLDFSRLKAKPWN